MTGPLVVITGASSGIGLALARVFAREGHALLLVSCNMTALGEMREDRTQALLGTSTTVSLP